MRVSIGLRNMSIVAGGLLLASSPSVFSAPASTTPAATPAPAVPASNPKPAMTADECAVWNRERSFAASVAHHDAAAFAEHVNAHAVFDAGSTDPTRGRDAIVAGWNGIIEGKKTRLDWYPNVVTIGGDGNLAVSRGPYWMEDLRPDPKQHYQIGEFNSIWIKDPDGQWRVLFDDGNAEPHGASADDVAKLVASLPKECPRS
jgi:ketosteroid isomerase-like protein